MRRRMGRAGARREGGRWLRREGGLALGEIVVGVAILVIALGGIYGLVSQSVRSFGVSEDFLDVQQNARVALGKLAEEAKWAQAVSADSPTCPWPNCVELSVSADNPIKNPPAAYTVRFQWNSGAQQMERVEGATVTPLADFITGVVFRYLNRNGADTTVAADVVRVEAGVKGERGRSQARAGQSARLPADTRAPDPRAAAPSAPPAGAPAAGADDPAGHRHLDRHRHPDADPYSDADADADARPASDPHGHGDAHRHPDAAAAAPAAGAVMRARR